MRRHAIHSRAHPEFAHAEEHIAPCRIRRGKLRLGLKIVFVEEVRSAAPPNNSGTLSAIAFIIASPALRVAMLLVHGERLE